MAVEDCNLGIEDLSDIITLDNIIGSDFSEFAGSQLCIPQDPIEDLEWFPYFPNDFISLNNVDYTEEWMSEHIKIKDDEQQHNEKWMPEHIKIKDDEQQHNEKWMPEHIKIKDDNEEEQQHKDDEYEYDNGFDVKPHTKDEDSDEKRDEASKKDEEYDNDYDFKVKSQSKDDNEKRDKAPKDKANHESLLQSCIWPKKIRQRKTAKRSNCVVTLVKRRCSHCETEDTPLWRYGPLGPKTLCNACGVRFKSGRLVPEYRPISSPSFNSTKHSNYHRNILKGQQRYSR